MLNLQSTQTNEYFLHFRSNTNIKTKQNHLNVRHNICLPMHICIDNKKEIQLSICAPLKKKKTHQDF